jgi:hypothetical protein
MNFWQYVFRFLYIRNWHTGQRELSRVRVYWFLGAVMVGVISVVAMYFLQLPVTATASV